MWPAKPIVIIIIIAALGGLAMQLFAPRDGGKSRQEVPEEVKKEQARQWIEEAQREAERRSKMSREEIEKENERRAQRERVFFFGGLAALFVVTAFFPRFGTFVLGPGICAATAWLIFSDKGFSKVLFSTGGDGWAGLGRLIVWIFVLLGFGLGAGIIAFGRARIRQQEQQNVDDLSNAD